MRLLCGVLGREIHVQYQVSATVFTLHRSNKNDAVGTARTVDGRSGSIFEYIDTLYVSHVKVVKTQISGDAINDNERVAVVNRTQTTDFNGHVITWLAGINDLQA